MLKQELQDKKLDEGVFRDNYAKVSYNMGLPIWKVLRVWLHGVLAVIPVVTSLLTLLLQLVMSVMQLMRTQIVMPRSRLPLWNT